MTTITHPIRFGTGEFRVVVPSGSQAAYVQRQSSGQSVGAPVARWWRGAGAGFIWTGLVGIVVAGFFAWIYVLLTDTMPDDAPARVLVVGAAISAMIAALVYIGLGCKARVDDRAQAQLLARLDSNAAAIIAGMDRAELLAEVRRAVGLHVGKLAEIVHQRFGELEQRMDEQDEKIEDLRTIASVFAQPPGSNGQVRQLRRR